MDSVKLLLANTLRAFVADNKIDEVKALLSRGDKDIYIDIREPVSLIA
jgi:hypothetical protein